MSPIYIFDKDDIRFRKKKASVWSVVRRILIFFVASVSMAILYYILFALVFSTEEEKKLRQENRMYSREYPARKSIADKGFTSGADIWNISS